MKQIAIISGKGGTGKSSICAAFATLSDNVIIADCDVDAANQYLLFSPSIEEEQIFIGAYKAVIDYNICTGCGLCSEYCRFDAIKTINGKVTIAEVSCDGCFLCSRLCPEKAINMISNDKSRLYSGTFRKGKMVYGWLAPGEENSGKLVNIVREKARETAKKNSIDTILIDGPPGIGCPVISTIAGTDLVIIITEPTISGLSDMKRAVEIVMKFNLKPSVIINKYDLNHAMTSQIQAWCNENKILVNGLLPFDKKMVESMVHLQTITEYDPENEVSEQLKKIWITILNREKL